MKFKVIIFDFAGTLFHSISQLAPGAEELLQFAKDSGLKIAGITSGNYDDTIIGHLGLDKYMDEIQVVADTGGKTPTVFDEMITKFGAKPEEAISVGDLASKEIRAMNMIGGTTIWIQGANPAVLSSNPDEIPDHSVKDLSEAKQVLEQLLKEEE